MALSLCPYEQNHSISEFFRPKSSKMICFKYFLNETIALLFICWRPYIFPFLPLPRPFVCKAIVFLLIANRIKIQLSIFISIFISTNKYSISYLLIVKGKTRTALESTEFLRIKGIQTHAMINYLSSCRYLTCNIFRNKQMLFMDWL